MKPTRVIAESAPVVARQPTAVELAAAAAATIPMKPGETFEMVYAVVEPIPQINALPGDELILRPSDPDFPVTILRIFSSDMMGAIPDDAIRMLSAGPSSVVSASLVSAPAAAAKTPTPLRLVG